MKILHNMFHSFVSEHHNFLHPEPPNFVPIHHFLEAETQKSENKCLIKKMSSALEKKPRKHSSEMKIEQTYNYQNWDDSKRKEWLMKHEKRIVCVLSVSLISKRIDIDDEFNRFTRKNMIIQALDTWTKHGWYPLVFVPIGNSSQYTECLKMETRWKDKVRIVAYNVEPETCGKSMVVGESRNAILNFVLKFKEIFNSCTISDERIEGFKYGIGAIGKLKVLIKKKWLKKDIKIYQDKCDEVDALRVKYGFKVLGLVKDFVSGKALEKKFKSTQKNFEDDCQNLMKSLQLETTFNTFIFTSAIFNKKNVKQSLWHALKQRLPTLIGISSSRAHDTGFFKNQEPIRESTRAAEKMAQFTIFKVISGKKKGEKGWHGQLFYTKTTMMEDNVWSYEWDKEKTLGNVAEIFCVSHKRLRGLSLTRREVNLMDYSKCALNELVKAVESDSYGIDGTMQWTTHSKKESLLSALPEPKKKDYWHMAALIAGIAAACDAKGINVPKKVRDICNVLNARFKEYFYKPVGWYETENKITRYVQRWRNENKNGAIIPIPDNAGIHALIRFNLKFGKAPEKIKWDELLLSDSSSEEGSSSEDSSSSSEESESAPEDEEEEENTSDNKNNNSDGEFVVINIKKTKAISSTGSIFESTIKFKNGIEKSTIIKCFKSKTVRLEIALTYKAYEGTDMKLYGNYVKDNTNTEMFITNTVDKICGPDIAESQKNLLVTTMKSLARNMGEQEQLGIMIMTNIHVFGKNLRHSSIHGRYPKKNTLKQPKYNKRWKFNALHEILRLHKKGIIHGDLNFGNVWVLENPLSGVDKDIGRVFVIDFGQSKYSSNASIMDELNALPKTTKEEKKYLKYSLPVALIEILNDKNIVNEYLKKYPDDDVQLKNELTKLNIKESKSSDNSNDSSEEEEGSSSEEEGSSSEDEEESEDESKETYTPPKLGLRIEVQSDMDDGTKKWFGGEIVKLTRTKITITKITIKWDDKTYKNEIYTIVRYKSEMRKGTMRPESGNNNSSSDDSNNDDSDDDDSNNDDSNNDDSDDDDSDEEEKEEEENPPPPRRSNRERKPAKPKDPYYRTH